MIVLVVEEIEEKERGEIKNSLLEIKHNVFVGCLSARIRDLLWERLIEVTGGAIMTFTINNSSGYDVRTHGTLKDTVVKIGNVFATKL